MECDSVSQIFNGFSSSLEIEIRNKKAGCVDWTGKFFYWQRFWIMWGKGGEKEFAILRPVKKPYGEKNMPHDRMRIKNCMINVTLSTIV